MKKESKKADLSKAAGHTKFYGTLPDFEIRRLVAEGSLITGGFSDTNIKQACYELRASSQYHVPLTDDVAHRTEPNGYILIKPKQLSVIITEEELAIPNDVLARILSKGQLFSIGLVPVNTYADPGFQGRLGIVLMNTGNNYIKIFPGETIAKIDFTRLLAPVESPYNGQHGYGTKIWPVKKDHFLTKSEQQADSRIGDSFSELEAAYGKPLTEAIRRIEKLQIPVILSGSIYAVFIVLLACAFGEGLINNSVLNVGLGILSTVVYLPITLIHGWYARRKERKLNER